jgi:[protein-PII] uridylyltransferase
MAAIRTSTSFAAHAREMLTPPVDRERAGAEIERALRRFRKVGEARLRMLHRAGHGGLEVCEKRASLMDAVLRHLWGEMSSHKDFEDMREVKISLVATGGYGRGQMNPCSDVDMLFLLPGNGSEVPPSVVQFVPQFITLLWDGGFNVGDSSTRSVGETLRQANADNQVKTALIDSRLIAGDKEPFEELKRRFETECMAGHERDFLRRRQEDLFQRHSKYQNTPFVQEPNVKNSCGGLRDYQNLIWTAYAKLRTTSLREVQRQGLLTPTALRELDRAYDFLLRVRNELHYIERRESDVLTLRLQGSVATHLGYRHKSILDRIEAFMRDYYTHTRNILQRSSELMDRFHLENVEEEQKRVLRGFLARRRAARAEKFDGFVSRNERIYAEHDRIFKEDPPRLMRLFLHTQQRHLRLSPELYQLVQKNFALVNQTFRYSKAVRESFFAILSQKGDVARVLRQMHRVGFLGRYVPEFGALTCLVQHEFFHRYTADEHTLRTIEELDELASPPAQGDDLYHQLFRQIQEPAILYLALLLHDTGRAANTLNHSDASALLASRVCRRLQITGERRRLLMFLVDHHLTLYRTATTKNLDDPEVVAEFGGIVRNKQFIDALMVMSCADSKGTSEKSWTAWKEGLQRHLYLNAVYFLNDPSDFTRRVTVPTAALQGELRRTLDESYDAEITAHFALMPQGYFNFRDTPTIARHLRLFREFFRTVVEGSVRDGLLPTLEWIERPEQACSELTAVCWDRHLLLARLAGSLAAQNINILSADLFRREDDLVLDIFRICTAQFAPVSNDRVKSRVEKLVAEAFQTPDFDFSAPIKEHRSQFKGMEDVAAEVPQRALVNNSLSATHTVVEVQALDRIGLLYDVFMAIGKLGLSVTHARINTEKGIALDTLYLQDRLDAKITDPAVLLSLHENLQRAVFST